MATAAVIRAFVALEVADTVREQLTGLMADLRSAGERVRWTKPENLHVTMAFLGEIQAEQVPDLAELMDRRCAKIASFSYRLKGVGFFGSRHFPRVLWVGIPSHPPAMSQIHRCGLRMAKKAGIVVRERSFSPHITVGRLRSREGVGELTSVISSYKTREFGVTDIKRVRFMQSTLGPNGARYSILHESHLKGANTHAT